MILEADLAGAVLEAYPLRDGLLRGAVVVCPGGGYSQVSEREAAPVARAFNRAGFHAFVLRYSVGPGPLGLLPLRQLGAAVAALRARAAEFSVDPRSVSVCGFSAGGHLAASLGVFWHDRALFGSGESGPADRLPEARRPDSLILCYPVVTSGDGAHRGSFERLAGTERGAQDAFSVERFVDGRTPPSFLWHTAEDEAVPVRNSILFFSALRDHGVPAELHVFPSGPHGLSLATPDVADPDKGRHADRRAASWFPLAAAWLELLPTLRPPFVPPSASGAPPSGAHKGS